MRYEKEKFSNENIALDFNQFIECEFVDCKLIYRGYGPVDLEGCSFRNVQWIFSDAAGNTIKFMAGIYSGAGEGGKKLIEDTFKNIKTGNI